jgi:hypothetical protein
MGNQRLKDIIEKQREQIKYLEGLVYCCCSKPDSNKFGLDNMCARCVKPIKDHPLSVGGKT